MARLSSIIILSVTAVLFNLNLYSQEIPHSVSNYGIYDFLDELANNQIISVNSAVKPYSRLDIAKLLEEADGRRELLTPRQMKELEFYLLDFGKELNGATVLVAKRRFRDSGKRYNDATEDEGKQRFSNSGKGSDGWGKVQWVSGKKYQKRLDMFYYKDSVFSLTVNPILGGEIFTNSSGEATYWRNGTEMHGNIHKFGFYASLRDNHEKPLLGRSQYLTQREGGHLKGATDWSDMQGGITWSW